jgi:hypothetical protein
MGKEEQMTTRKALKTAVLGLFIISGASAISWMNIELFTRLSGSLPERYRPYAFPIGVVGWGVVQCAGFMSGRKIAKGGLVK